MEFTYPCLRVRQDAVAKDLLVFAAPAIEIDGWVGIPQRLSLEGDETAGFQRTVSKTREAALKEFFADPHNVIQNPLLCAIRNAAGVKVTFTPRPDDDRLGTVAIKIEDWANMTLSQLLAAVRAYLEDRDPELRNRATPTELQAQFEQRLDPELLTAAGLEAPDDADDEDPADDVEADDVDHTAEPAEEALFDESQMSEFWDNVRAREEIARKLQPASQPDELLGFSRDVLISYLRPVILVDGQHRLRGAVLAALDQAANSDKAKDLIVAGLNPAEARRRVVGEMSRTLPVSLLMDASPAEHVFQYVVVNQKATPVPRALLGTIISTSLAADELAGIAERLENAKVPLEGARVISLLSRAADSPFNGLVAKGLDGDGADKLPWTVLGSLADVFRHLEGARFYHEPTDHAKIWRMHHLADSPIVADWQARDYASPRDFWEDRSGPWMAVFKTFWTQTRDRLANVSNPAAPNYWGHPRTSNLFNKPSLHILTADFFAYLKEGRRKIDSADHVASLVDEWLAYASPNYFSRDWRTQGVKKDSVGTRRQWSKLWAAHRQAGGSPPPAAEFSKILKA